MSAAAVSSFGADLLRASLEANFNGYTKNVWGTITAVLVAIGWLLTSEKSRIFLSRNLPARRAAILATVVIFVIHGLALADIAISSNELMALVEADPFIRQEGLSAEYFQRFQVPWRFAAASMALDGTLFLLLIVLLNRMGGWKEPE